MLKKLNNNFYFWFYNSVLSFIFLSFFIVEPWRKALGDLFLTNRTNIIFFWLVGALVFSLVFYILGYSRLKKIKIDFKKIFLFFVVLNVVLMFIWPIGSNDTFSYIYQSRLVSHHQANPYVDTYANFEQDEFFSAIVNKWSSRTAPYGPLFLAIGSLLTWLGGNSLILTLLLFKLVMVATNILCAWLLYKITKSIRAFYLYAFNPLIIFEVVINGHNDVLLIALAILGLGFLYKNGWQNKSWAIVLFIVSMLVKFYSLLLLPFVALKGFLDLKRDKLKLVSVGIISLIVLPVISFSWLTNSFRQALSPLFDQSAIAGSLSFVVWAIHKWGGASVETALIISRTLFVIGLFAVFLYWLCRRQKTNFYFILAIVMGMFCLTYFTWFMPWYFLFLLTLLIAGHVTTKNKGNELASLIIIYFISFWGIIYYVGLR